MPDREDYATAEQIRDDLNIDPDVDSRAAAVVPALNAAHDAVDRYCRRGKFSRIASEARTFTLRRDQTWVRCGDMAIVPTLVEVRDTYSDSAWTSLAATDWVAREPHPDKAALGHPYRTLDRISTTGEQWPAAAFPTIQVTTEWGWAEVPDSVVQSTRLCAVRYIARFKHTILAAQSHPGGVDELLRSDPDIYVPLKRLQMSRAGG